MKVINGEECYTKQEICNKLNIKEYNVRYMEKVLGMKVYEDPNNKNKRLYPKKCVESMKKLEKYRSLGLEYKVIKMAMEGKVIKLANTSDGLLDAKDVAVTSEIIESEKDESACETYNEVPAVMDNEKSLVGSSVSAVIQQMMETNDIGDVMKQLSLILTGTSVDMTGTIVNIESGIQTVVKQNNDQKRAIKSLNEKLDKMLKEDEKLNRELLKKIEKHDIELVNKLKESMDKSKDKSNKKKSFFRRIFG